jgi:CheY-like chemotaxis protein
VNWSDPKLVILVLEDDENDVFILKRSFQKNGIQMPVHVCHDGEDGMAYLKGSGRYADRKTFPFPRVLITDLKMPKCSGFEILEWLQLHPECNLIPKVVLSASNHETDVIRAYQLGANCYFKKPSSIDDLSRIVRTLHEFWSCAEIPPLPVNC